MDSPAHAPSDDSITVPWNDFVRFVRQLSHDLRNHLNAAELQAAFLSELASDAETKDEIKHLREMMSTLTTVLQKLSTSLAAPKLNRLPYRVVDFMEDIQKRVARDFPKEAANVAWKTQTGETAFEIDPQLMQEAIIELFTNAFRNQKAGQSIEVIAQAEAGFIHLTWREQKENFAMPTENWGREPLRSITQGHYGLGLNRARVIFEAHGGRLAAEYDPSCSMLTTTVTLPATTTGP